MSEGRRERGLRSANGHFKDRREREMSERLCVDEEREILRKSERR